MAPLCVSETCVVCTEAEPGVCEGTTPVCDDASNTCVACIEHDECGEAACNLFSGACLPAEAVVRVGTGQKYATLGDALATVAEGAQATVIVHGNDAFDEAGTVDGGRVVAFLANDGDLPRWILSGGGAPQLTVLDGTVLMEGIQMSGNADDRGLVVDGGQAWVDGSRIVQNTGGGVLAQNGAELVLRNCFVGGSVNNVPAVNVNGADLRMLYSTVGAGFGTSTALTCEGAFVADIRNSIFVAETDTDEVVCSGEMATIEYSAAEFDLGGTNTPLAPLDTAWFAGYGAGTFSLTKAGADIFRDIAQWQEGDPLTDIDGDLRPTTDATPDYAGADVPL